MFTFSARGEVPLMRNGNGFEARVNAKRPEDRPNVVADRLDAEVQIGRYLLRGAPAFEKAQDLALAWRQARMRRRGSIVLLDLLRLPENPDDVVITRKRDGAHLRPEPLTVRPQADELVIRTFRRPQEIAGEDLPTSSPFLR